MKRILLPLLSVLSGAAGFLLRRWQLAGAYDAERELFLQGAPATLVLLGVLAAAVLATLVLVQGGTSRDHFLPAFRAPDPMYMTVLAAAAFLMIGAGALGLLEGMAQLTLWRTSPETYILTYPVSLLLCSLLCFPAGLALLMLGKGIYRSDVPHAASLLACFPAFAALVWLFATHLNHATDPVLMRYGFGLAAAGLLTLGHYHIAGFFFGRCHTRRTLFCLLTGVSLALTSLADFNGRFVMALTAAFSLSALTWSCALLRNTFGPSRTH